MATAPPPPYGFAENNQPGGFNHENQQSKPVNASKIRQYS